MQVERMKSKNQKAFEEYEKARSDLFKVVTQVLKIDKLVDWLNRKLSRK